MIEGGSSLPEPEAVERFGLHERLQQRELRKRYVRGIWKKIYAERRLS